MIRKLFLPFIELIHSRPFFTNLVISVLVLLSACHLKERPKQYVIGFSQCVEADSWRKTMLNEMKRELSLHDNIVFLHEQADGNSNKQIQQIKDLVHKHVDLLIVSPNEVQPLSAIIEQVYDAGTPVIVVDRRTDSKSYSSFIGASNFEVGQDAGRYAALLLKGKGRIIEVTGLPGASPVIDRHNGFMDIIAKYPGLTYVREIDGDWSMKSFRKTVEDSLTKYRNIQLVFAQNDRMAFDVYKICKKLHLDDKIKIIGIDGLPWKDEGLDMVANKYIAATVLYPTGGQEAILTAVNILEHKPYKKENQLFTTIIDSSNVRIVKLQNEKVQAQQEDIDRRQLIIQRQEIVARNKTTVIYIISFSLALALIFGSILFYSLRKNRKMNQKLQLQNLEILEQKNQLELQKKELEVQKKELEELSVKVQAANEAKVNFFTNMSHEFKTPLTLILAPVEELLAQSKSQYQQNQNLHLIHKNAIRLLRLVNQLMDFRKIEGDKMRLHASENNLVAFLSEIIESFESIAHKKNIDLRFITRERQLNVWFDVNMLDKVIFNLLSNAFKFTRESDYIYVYVDKVEYSNDAIIKVEDSGIGMSEESVKNVFNIFYQGEYENHKGSGLGLALSKQLVELHKGRISVRSEKYKGTTFELRLPLGNAHLEKQDLTESATPLTDLLEDMKGYTTDLKTEPVMNDAVESVKNEKDYSLLIIEDNGDLRAFLKTRLGSQYEILEADNGQSALQQAFDFIPDLIICDIVIPGKDGLALTNILKNDIRTSHIPIIMLTAKTNVEYQIQGMKNLADAYITKPFNSELLDRTIKSLLTNRAMLKEHFTADLPSNLKTQTVGKLDRKFINEFTSLVENNLSDDNFSVEDISKKMSISRMQLHRKIKALLDINVNDYILNTRLQKAKYFLQHEELSISEIAYKVGFSSPAYFSTVFKSKCGLTPKAFKEK